MRSIRCGVVLGAWLVIAGLSEARGGDVSSEVSWQQDFDLSARNLVSSGRNEYFILEPGFRLTLENETETLQITVLHETRKIVGFETRVVEEREWKNGELTEISRNFFAICDRTGDVFYFGEDVDMYRNGKIANHKGQWLAGKRDARAGLIMSGDPVLDMSYYQEIAPGVVMDRARVIALDASLETPAGRFENCLKTKEGTALNFFEREYKTYAPGVGLVQEQRLILTSYGFVEKD